ncbi:MAG TPA: D-tyrosyl-tRNA(Tyr) deacylase [Clostridia bacterium]|nr:D-tyrosyl-tRNA(Tyr) deacylase [Clostridia bacterium]
MRAVVQRVKKASVSVNGEITGKINEGLVVLLGVGEGDSAADAEYLAEKTANLRIFEDEKGKLNLSCLDIGGELLVVSQFTLYGDCRKGRRPSFSSAAQPGEALPLYEDYVQRIRGMGLNVATGLFREEMTVEIHNHGPVTILLDSRKKF